eukprot:gene2586-2996_t
MLIQCCKESFSCEVTIDSDSNRQLLLTIFPKTWQQFFGDSSIDEYEETLLSMENIDLEFTKKMIVAKMTSHTDSSAQDMELQPIIPAKDNDVIHAPEQTDFIQTESTMLLKDNGVILETESIKPAEDNDVIQHVIQEADFKAQPTK